MSYRRLGFFFVPCRFEYLLLNPYLTVFCEAFLVILFVYVTLRPVRGVMRQRQL